MRAPQSNPRSPHDVATARMYQRRKQLGLPRREACASARILKFVTFTLGTDPPRFAPPQRCVPHHDPLRNCLSGHTARLALWEEQR